MNETRYLLILFFILVAMDLKIYYHWGPQAMLLQFAPWLDLIKLYPFFNGSEGKQFLLRLKGWIFRFVCRTKRYIICCHQGWKEAEPESWCVSIHLMPTYFLLFFSRPTHHILIMELLCSSSSCFLIFHLYSNKSSASSIWILNTQLERKWANRLPKALKWINRFFFSLV